MNIIDLPETKVTFAEVICCLCPFARLRWRCYARSGLLRYVFDALVTSPIRQDMHNALITIRGQTISTRYRERKGSTDLFSGPMALKQAQEMDRALLRGRGQ